MLIFGEKHENCIKVCRPSQDELVAIKSVFKVPIYDISVLKEADETYIIMDARPESMLCGFLDLSKEGQVLYSLDDQCAWCIQCDEKNKPEAAKQFLSLFWTPAVFPLDAVDIKDAIKADCTFYNLSASNVEQIIAKAESLILELPRHKEIEGVVILLSGDITLTMLFDTVEHISKITDLKEFYQCCGQAIYDPCSRNINLSMFIGYR